MVTQNQDYELNTLGKLCRNFVTCFFGLPSLVCEPTLYFFEMF